MHFLYSKWQEGSSTDEQRLQQMVSLFNYLVVQSSGDVEQALEWLRELAREYGLFDENMTLDDLVDKLREMGLIEEVNDVLTLTTKGVQRIRRDALDGAVVDTDARLFAGDVLLLYTDGITEAMNAKREMFGIERLSKALHSARAGTARAIRDSILAEVTQWMDRQFDDFTLVVARYVGPKQDRCVSS